MKKILFITIFCISLFGMQKGFSQVTSVWTGAIDTAWYHANPSASEFTIYSASELAGLATLVNSYESFEGKTIYVGNGIDQVIIDLNNRTWQRIGTGYLSKYFKGHFDGRNCVIKNLATNPTTWESYKGLFGYVLSTESNSAIIENVNVSGNAITNFSYIGGIAGFAKGVSPSKKTIIRNCTFNGEVAGVSYVGGIVGRMEDYCDIYDCAVCGTIRALETYGAGIAGLSTFPNTTPSAENYNRIIGCTNAAWVYAPEGAGGIAGYMKNTTIAYCNNGGCVYGSNSSMTGGIAGYTPDNNNKIEYNINTGTLIAGSSILGPNYTTNLSYCYYDNQRSRRGGASAADRTNKAEGKHTSAIVVTTDGVKPTALAGTASEWTDHFEFIAGYYPIPKNVSSKIAAILAALPIGLPESPTVAYYNEPADFSLMGGYTYTSSNTSIVNVESNPATIGSAEGSAIITATSDEWSKEFIIEKPYTSTPPELTIANLSELETFRNAVNAGASGSYQGVSAYNGFKGFTIKITDDIDMSSNSNWTPIGTAENPFCGTIDGQNFLIKDITVQRTNHNSGLLGVVNSATIRNIKLTGNITSTSLYVGGFCGRTRGVSSDSTRFINCHFYGKIKSSSYYTGGIIGYAGAFCVVENCSVGGEITSASHDCGGMIGQNASQTRIENCINIAEIKALNYAGGIIGYANNQTKIYNCLNAGNIYGTSENTGGIVAFIGNNASQVIHCLNTGTVSSGGSIVGVKNSGYNPTFTNNYYDKQRSVIGGITNEDVAGSAEGMTTAEICALDASFSDKWNYISGSYPTPKNVGCGEADDAVTNLVKIAAAKVTFDGEEVYNELYHNFTVASGFTWSSSNIRLISVSGTDATLTHIDPYGAVVLTASISGLEGIEYKKKVLTSVLGENPYDINDEADLIALSNAVNSGLEGSYKGLMNMDGYCGKTFNLTSDIAMTAANFTPIGTDSNPFRGNFEGNHHKISNLNVTRTSSFSGLFGYIQSSCSTGGIKNIVVEGNVRGTQYVGGIVGFGKGLNKNTYFVIENCHFNGTVIASSSYTGGICGSLGVYTKAKYCTTTGSVTSSSSNVGGIAGRSSGESSSSISTFCTFARDSVLNCANNAIVKGTTSVGGICGSNYMSDVRYCLNAGEVITSNGNATSIGGIVGTNDIYRAYVAQCLNVYGFNAKEGNIIGDDNDTITALSCPDRALTENKNYYDLQMCALGIETESNGTGKLTSELVATANGTKPAGLSTFTDSQWQFKAGYYPIPIPDSYSIAQVPALLAATPVKLNVDPAAEFADTNTNQLTTRDFNVTVSNGQVWDVSDPSKITINGSTGAAHIEEQFMRLTLTATIDDYSKQIYIANTSYVPPIAIRNETELKAFRDAVNNGNSGVFEIHTYNTTTRTVNDEIVMAYNVNGYKGADFYLVNNIEGLTNADWTAIGTALQPFKGNFHGQNKKITNLRTSGSYTGLFGYIEESSIDSLTLIGRAYINSTNGSISNDNKISGSSYVGGLVGFAKMSNILQCHVSAVISNSGSYTGGICGNAIATSIEECDFCGKVISNGDYAGGICGNATGEDATGSKILSCTNAASISGSNHTGGIVGLCANSSEIKYCNNGGNVSATTEYTGGICGTLNASSLTYCITTGGVNMGGPIVGATDGEATVYKCYFDKQRCDLTDGRAYVYDKYTSEMQGTALQSVLGSAEWSYTANLYPVPKKINEQAGATLAAIPLTLDKRSDASHQTYRLVSENFNLVVPSGATWKTNCALNTETGRTYLKIESNVPTVNGAEKDCANIFLKYNDNFHVKTFFIQNPETMDPIPITSLTEFIKFRNAVNAGETGSYRGVVNEGGFTGKNFRLTTDIDLSGSQTAQVSDIDIKNDFKPIGSSTTPFKGNFNGSGHTISKLQINGNANNNNTPVSYRALFGYVIGSTIDSLNVICEPAGISGTQYVAGICAYIKGVDGDNYANIRNCTFNGTVASTSSNIGGICGRADTYTNIIACEVSGRIAGGAGYSGGIVGYAVGTEYYRNYIDSCINIANVGGTSSAGGICGQDSYCDVNHCINGGNISGANYSTGGIVGYNGGYISYCLNTGNTNTGGAITGYGNTCLNCYYDKTRTSVFGIANSSNVSSDPDGASTGLTPQQMVGTTPSGITGAKWTNTYWTFADDRYPVLKGRTSDIAQLSALPIYLNDPTISQVWNNAHYNFKLCTTTDAYTWNSSDPEYVNISNPNDVAVDAEAHEGEICNSILTVTKDNVAKKYIITSQDPPTDLYIDNLSDLEKFRDAVNDRDGGKYKGVLNTNGFLDITFHITNDITVGDEHWEAIGSSSSNFFAGNIDGNNHIISNLNFNTGAEIKYFGGFFGKVYGGYVKNLTVRMRSAGEGVPNVVNETGFFGGICAYIEGVNNDKRKAIIENCKFVGDSIYQNAQANGTGCICGYAGNYTEIYNCIDSASIVGRNYTGGIVGRMENTSSPIVNIHDCVNTGNIGVAAGGGNYIAGICGYYNTSGYMDNCTNTGNIFAKTYCGGIVGRFNGNSAINIAKITRCTNYGNVQSDTDDGYVGGIAGWAYSYSEINKCVNSGEITGKKHSVGGIVGRANSAVLDKENVIQYCANCGAVRSINTSSSNYIGGICGSAERTIIRYNNNGANVVGATANSVGGIVGDSDENSTIEYNIATGTVEKGGSICGKNKGTATNNLYDSQRSIAKGIGSADVEGSAEGKTTTQLTGSALTGATWTSNFVMNSNMYPMPKFTNTKTESIIASTPIFITSSPAVEIYDSVWNNFTVSTENGVAWSVVEDPANIEISGTAATITRICDEDVPQTLLVTKDGVSKKVKVIIAKYESPELAEITATPEISSGVCLGQKIALETTSGYDSYEWAGANLLSDDTYNVEAQPTIRTTYTVTATNGHNCTSTVNITITPDNSPTAKTTSNDYVWTGAINDAWNTNNNWVLYNNSTHQYQIPAEAPNASTHNVFVEQYGTGCVTNWANASSDIALNNITLEANTEATATANMTISGNIANAGILNLIGDVTLNGTVQQTLSGSGTLTINNINVNNTHSDGVIAENTLDITGNVTVGNNSKLNVTGTAVFNGNATQTLSGAGSMAVSNVVFNNSNGFNATGLENNLAVNASATFTNGIYDGNMVFGKSANAIDASRISYVNGEVSKTGNGDSFIFPTGNDNVYGQIEAIVGDEDKATIRFHHKSGHGFSESEYPRWWNLADMDPGNNPQFDHVSNFEYWNVFASADLTDATLSIYAGDANDHFSTPTSFDIANIYGAMYKNGLWRNIGGGSGSVSPSGETIILENVTILGNSSRNLEFTKTSIGSKSQETILPIELLSFSAHCNGNTIGIDWSTASERNNDYFILEKSLDAINFNEIARIAGAGKSIEQIDYSYTDYDYYGGDVYYRLIQVDYDGTKTYSEIISAKCSNWETDPNISVFPNPFSSELTIVLENFRNEPATIEIFDVMGRTIKQMQVDSPHNEYETSFNLDNIPAGIYNVRVRTSSSTLNRQIVKE